MSFQDVLQKLMSENCTSNVSLGKALGVSDVAVMRWTAGFSRPERKSKEMPRHRDGALPFYNALIASYTSRCLSGESTEL